MPTKKIVCLANSRKLSGRCVAGKEYLGRGRFGTWIRPVSSSLNRELSRKDIAYEGGGYPEPLDIISIPLKDPCPECHQVENILVDCDYWWVKEGTLEKSKINNMIDDAPTLWSNGYHSFNGMNDRVPKEEAGLQIKSSLVLIKPDSFSIRVENEMKGKKARARFIYKNVEYWLVITDPIEEVYKRKATGDYVINEETYLCISLGEPLQGWCYKLVAGVVK